MLDRLERAGYARRAPDPSDRRRVLVELTPGARADAARPVRARSPADTLRQLEGYTTEQVSLVRDFMRDNRQLSETHTERVRGRRRFAQEGEAASS